MDDGRWLRSSLLGILAAACATAVGALPAAALEPAPAVGVSVTVPLVPSTTVSLDSGSKSATLGSAGGKVAIGSGGGTVSVPSGTLQAPGGSTVTTSQGGTMQVPSGGGTVSVPSGGATVTVPAGSGGQVLAAPVVAPGFYPASASFRSLGAAPPRAIARLLAPFPIVLIEGTYTRRGVRVTRLSILAPLGSRMVVSCSGRRCPRGLRSRASVATARASARTGRVRAVRFKRFQRRFRAGAALEIRVTAAGKIGKYTRFNVRRGKPPARADMCVQGRRRTLCPQ